MEADHRNNEQPLAACVALRAASFPPCLCYSCAFLIAHEWNRLLLLLLRSRILIASQLSDSGIFEDWILLPLIKKNRHNKMKKAASEAVLEWRNSSNTAFVSIRLRLLRCNWRPPDPTIFSTHRWVLLYSVGWLTSQRLNLNHVTVCKRSTHWLTKRGLTWMADGLFGPAVSVGSAVPLIPAMQRTCAVCTSEDGNQCQPVQRAH